MKLFKILSIDQDIVQVYYNKDIKLFSENLIDVVLKADGCVRQAKEHYLVLKVAVSGMKGCLLLITFSNLCLMVNTSEIQLGKLLGPVQTI